MRENIVLIGGGNQANYTLDIIKESTEYNVVGIIDSLHEVGEILYGLKVLGRQEDILSICQDYDVNGVVITIGDNYTRFRIKETITKIIPEVRFPNIIHSSAIISKSATLGVGIVVMAGCIINPRANLGNFVFLATGAQVEHDCDLCDYASISAGSVLGGYVKIGRMSALTLGVTVLDRVEIGENTVVGSGSLVTKSLPKNVLVYGSPARIIRSIELGYRFLK